MPTELIMPDITEQFEKAEMKETLLYGGKVRLMFDGNDGNHDYYRRTGEGPAQIDTPVMNATTILGVIDKSGPLMGWQAKLMGQFVVDELPKFLNAHLESTEEFAARMKKYPRAAVNKAADIGKLAHEWLEQYGKRRLSGLDHHSAAAVSGPDGQAGNCVDAALDWIEEHHVTPIAAESKVYSMDDNVAGTLDWIGLVDGKISLIDFKSSNGLYPSFRFQTAFYKKAWEEETGRKIDQRILLRLGKDDGEFEVHTFDNEQEYWQDYYAFRGCQLLAERLEAIKTSEKRQKRDAKVEKARSKKRA